MLTLSFLMQNRYLEKYPPTKVADMIIDITNWEYPCIKYMLTD